MTFTNGQKLVWRKASTSEKAVEKIAVKNCTFIRYGFLKNVWAYVQLENSRYTKNVLVSELSVE